MMLCFRAMDACVYVHSLRSLRSGSKFPLESLRSNIRKTEDESDF